MTKYLRSRHVPLDPPKSQAIEKGIDEFIGIEQEAGNTLKSLRESRGWTHADLADRVGLEPDYIALMEQGQRPITPTFAKMFGDVFEIDYQALL